MRCIFPPSLKSGSRSIRANWYIAFNSAHISSSSGLLLFTECRKIQSGCFGAQPLRMAHLTPPWGSPKFAILKSEARRERVWGWTFNDVTRSPWRNKPQIAPILPPPLHHHPQHHHPDSWRTQRNTFKSPLMKHLSITPLPLPYTCLGGGIWKWLK